MSDIMARSFRGYFLTYSVGNLFLLIQSWIQTNSNQTQPIADRIVPSFLTLLREFILVSAHLQLL